MCSEQLRLVPLAESSICDVGHEDRLPRDRVAAGQPLFQKGPQMVEASAQEMYVRYIYKWRIIWVSFFFSHTKCNMVNKSAPGYQGVYWISVSCF